MFNSSNSLWYSNLSRLLAVVLSLFRYIDKFQTFINSQCLLIHCCFSSCTLIVTRLSMLIATRGLNCSPDIGLPTATNPVRQRTLEYFVNLSSGGSVRLWNVERFAWTVSLRFIGEGISACFWTATNLSFCLVRSQFEYVSRLSRLYFNWVCSNMISKFSSRTYSVHLFNLICPEIWSLHNIWKLNYTGITNSWRRSHVVLKLLNQQAHLAKLMRSILQAESWQIGALYWKVRAWMEIGRPIPHFLEVLMLTGK